MSIASMSLGKFITIEGQDGAGKTTNIDYLCERLKQERIDFIVTREPGGTEFGEALRNVLLSRDEISINPLAELLLIFAARSQHLSEVIEPSLKSGKWVICDRFTDASYAYQGGGHGVEKKVIAQIADLVQQGREPDLTILLDLDIITGESRVNARNDEKDRFEKQQSDFKGRVRQSYLELAKRNPDRIQIIDASLTLNAVKVEVNRVISDFLNRAY